MDRVKEQNADDDGDELDRDEDGDLDVEHFSIPAGLLKAAGIESDEDWNAL